MSLVSLSYRSFSFKTKVNLPGRKHLLSVAYSSLYSRSSQFLADIPLHEICQFQCTANIFLSGN